MKSIRSSFIAAVLIVFANTLFAQAPKDSVQVDTQYVAAIILTGFQDEQVAIQDTVKGRTVFYTITQPSFTTINRVLRVVRTTKFTYQPLQPSDPKYDPTLAQFKFVPTSQSNKITIAGTEQEVSEQTILTALPVQFTPTKPKK